MAAYISTTSTDLVALFLTSNRKDGISEVRRTNIWQRLKVRALAKSLLDPPSSLVYGICQLSVGNILSPIFRIS